VVWDASASACKIVLTFSEALKVGCWFVHGDDLTGAMHDLQLQLSPPPSSSLAPIKPANRDSPGKMAVKTEREIL